MNRIREMMSIAKKVLMIGRNMLKENFEVNYLTVASK